MTPLTPLEATLMILPTSVANKRLTGWLSLLDATLTKNIGVGWLSLTRNPFGVRRLTLSLEGLLALSFEGARVSGAFAWSKGESRTTDRRTQLATFHLRTYAKDGARERTRTSTTLRSLAPEASASASSATRARVRVHPDRVGVMLDLRC